MVEYRNKEDTPKKEDDLNLKKKEGNEVDEEDD
jgi:hypothetical protein